MSDELLSQAGGPLHRLILNRPARRNALTPALARQLAHAIDEIEEAGEARVILLTGAGGHFCSGLDLHWLTSLRASPSIADLQHGLSDFQSAVIAIVRCPIPVVAVIQGTAAGFGLDLALACDMRLAGTSANFTSAFARMGLVPDGGSTFTLPRLVGVGRALRVLMTNQTLDAPTAHAIGLVEEVLDEATLDEGVDRILRELLSSTDSSIRAIKRLCRAPEVGALEQALSSEGAAQLQALQGAEFLLRLEAFTLRASARSEGS
ncbi:MAG TPA: enoyl-CoA hydratase/isomerase family protein [Gemmatimonadales bacterium]|jgi:enoyl-CoA hydratase/carnithine racemase|nr:enoyl-CoA hydratase/isomerase family protein [Gemmatimonadales bacterium]